MAYGRLRAQQRFGGTGNGNRQREERVFIKSIGQIAQEGWRERHICLPSIVIAISLEVLVDIIEGYKLTVYNS